MQTKASSGSACYKWFLKIVTTVVFSNIACVHAQASLEEFLKQSPTSNPSQEEPAKESSTSEKSLTFDPSFSCDGDLDAVRSEICKEGNLIEYDVWLDELFNDVLADPNIDESVGGLNSAEIAGEHEKWIEELKNLDLEGDTSPYGAIEEAYGLRLAELIELRLQQTLSRAKLNDPENSSLDSLPHLIFDISALELQRLKAESFGSIDDLLLAVDRGVQLAYKQCLIGGLEAGAESEFPAKIKNSSSALMAAINSVRLLEAESAISALLNSYGEQRASGMLRAAEIVCKTVDSEAVIKVLEHVIAQYFFNYAGRFPQDSRLRSDAYKITFDYCDFPELRADLSKCRD